MVTGNSLLCGGYGLLEYDIFSLVDRYGYCQESVASMCRAEHSTALGSTETLLLTYQSTCTHIPDNDINMLGSQIPIYGNHIKAKQYLYRP